ncbi:putative traB domain-containing protein [Sesbania bispinosa]|nr:putative traB domain-containing protein [Sesbania bispinosa]
MLKRPSRQESSPTRSTGSEYCVRARRRCWIAVVAAPSAPCISPLQVRVLPEELSRNVLVLSCESTARR